MTSCIVFGSALQVDGKHPLNACAVAVRKAIDRAQKHIQIWMYMLNARDICDGLKEAKRRGVCVQVLVYETRERSCKLGLQRLLADGDDIAIHHAKPTDPEGQSHVKMMIVDAKELWVGSFNFTQAGSKRNDELVACLTEIEPVHTAMAAFEVKWRDSHAWPRKKKRKRSHVHGKKAVMAPAVLSDGDEAPRQRKHRHTAPHDKVRVKKQRHTTVDPNPLD